MDPVGQRRASRTSVAGTEACYYCPLAADFRAGNPASNSYTFAGSGIKAGEQCHESGTERDPPTAPHHPSGRRLIFAKSASDVMENNGQLVSRRPACKSLMGVRVLAPAATSPTLSSPTTTCTSASASTPTGSSSAPASPDAATPCRTRPPATCATRPPALHRAGRGQAARHRPACARHLHARHVVPLDRLPAAGPAKLNCPAIEVEAACAGFMYALITGAAYVVSGRQRPGPDHRRRLQLAHPQPRRHQDLPALRRRRRRRAADAAAGRTRASSATAWAPTAAAATC